MATAFDPSIISQIPDMAPNPMRAKEAGYRLADIIDSQQLNRLKLNTAKTDEVEADKAKNILKTSDYSTPEGVTKTAEKLSRAGLGDKAMEFMKTMQQLQSSKGELTKQQYEILTAKNDLIGNAAASLTSQYDALMQRGIPDAQARGMLQPKYQEALQALGQTKLPDGTPALGPQDLKQIQSNPQFNPEFVRTLAQQSKEGAAALKAQLEFHKQQTVDRQAITAEKREAAYEEDVKSRSAARGGAYTPEGLDVAVQNYVQTGTLPRTAASQVKVLNAAAQLFRDQGKTAEAGVAEAKLSQARGKSMAALQKTQSFLKTAEETVNEHFKLADEYLGKVTRERFPAINAAIIAGEAKGLGDKNERAYAVALYEALLEYAKIIGGGAQSVAQITEGARDQARSLLSTADNPDAVHEVMSVVRRGAAIKLKSYDHEIEDLMSLNTGEGESPPQEGSSAAPPAAPPPAAVTPAAAPAAAAPPAKAPAADLGKGLWR